ncbi:MAG TPA: hypothetical protein VIJ31_11900 [Acidothermaceae bacterium]
MEPGVGGSEDKPGGIPAGAHVVVPDDARELARDIAAWRREERWKRRRRVFERMLGGGATSTHGGGATSTHGGRTTRALSAPIIITLMIAAALLGATLIFPGRTPEHQPTAPVPLVLAAPTAAPGTVGGLVPDDALVGQTGATTARALRPALLAVTQHECACAAALTRLAAEAADNGLTIYLIGSQAQQSELNALAGNMSVAVRVMVDKDSAITAAFAKGTLTVVAVHADGVIEQIVNDFTRTTSLDAVLPELKQPAHAGA